MKTSHLLAVLLLASPLSLLAQTKPTSPPPAAKQPSAQPVPVAPPVGTAAPQQITEVTEELDPVTGKVIRRTTRTTTLPAGTPAPARPTVASPTAAPAAGKTGDAQVSDFFREKTAVGRLSAPALVDAYARFTEKVRNDRYGWRTADWNTAAAVLSTLNARYEQLRSSFSFDDKLTIRSQQAEFQTLRTARQLSDQVSDKL